MRACLVSLLFSVFCFCFCTVQKQITETCLFMLSVFCFCCLFSEKMKTRFCGFQFFWKPVVRNFQYPEIVYLNWNEHLFTYVFNLFLILQILTKQVICFWFLVSVSGFWFSFLVSVFIIFDSDTKQPLNLPPPARAVQYWIRPFRSLSTLKYIQILT